jgi:hypothetical protein
MQRFARAAAIASLSTIPATLAAQGHFEGVITARVAAQQGGTDVQYSIKGDQFRMDMSSNGMSMFMLRDAAKNSTMMVMPAQRMYMETSGDMAASMQGERKLPDIKLTGKTEKIAGYECEHILLTGDDGQYDVCAAKGIGTFVTMMGGPMGRGRGAQAAAWQRLGRDLFPLKVQKVGNNEVAFEVTKVEKKSLDNSLFSIPEGFTKMGRP